ncbi:MAG: STAS domain-containing protein [Ardenticatenaceae bacterium]|nr:STAS domain-containing protein [Ardenticatenaceae bacterium]
MLAALKPAIFYLQRPSRVIRGYDKVNLRADVIAGITVAVIALPQAIAFTLIADLPPKMGLYATIVGAIVGALWGSSDQSHTGPANAISLLVLSALPSMAVIGEEQFILAAGLMAVMAGVFQLLLGLARLGVLVNFVSHSVVVGFSSGAGILIAIKQIGPLLGTDFPTSNILEAAYGFVTTLGEVHMATAVIGIGTIFVLILCRRLSPRLPAAVISMILATGAVYMFHLDQQGVSVIGQLPQNLPPIARLPLFDLNLIATLSTGALAIGAIGLVQTSAIARSIASQTGQRLDSNQEFVGQGLANIFCGFFSGYPVASSFSRAAVNLKAGAKTPIAAIFSSIFVLIAMFILAPAAAFLPTAALAGVLIIVAYGMINVEEIGRIWRGTPGDGIIMLVTFLGTLFLKIEFSVLIGLLFSFGLYIMRTSNPRVQAVLPDMDFKHFTYQPDKPHCPQLAVIEIQGDLYFGAVSHIEENILAHLEAYPDQRYLLIRMHNVNHCDFSGVHMLENIIRVCQDRGGDMFMVRVNYRVQKVFEATGFDEHLGSAKFLPEDEAISHLFYRVIDPAVCIYECPIRAFKECQNLPKRVAISDIPLLQDIPQDSVVDITPLKLWERLHNGAAEKPPLVVDVREPREFGRGHLPEARLEPLPTILSENVHFPNDRDIVFVCRSGRRSRRAAYALRQMGIFNVMILRGGMLAWEAEGLLEAID